MKLILTLLFLACFFPLLTSCSTTGGSPPEGPLTSLYDKEGNEKVKVGEKELATVTEGDSVPVVRLDKGSKLKDFGDYLIDAGTTVGKGVVQTWIEGQMQRVNPSK